MERTVKNLFDFQRFRQNPKLASIILDTEGRCGRAVSDDDLEWVSAAGEESPQLYESEYGERVLQFPADPGETKP